MVGSTNFFQTNIYISAGIEFVRVEDFYMSRCLVTEKEVYGKGTDYPALLPYTLAKHFAQQHRFTLPTKAQWESAYGKETYPWGNNPPSTRHTVDAFNSAQEIAFNLRFGGLFNYSPGRQIVRYRGVPRRKLGASKDGVHDMIGYLLQWLDEDESLNCNTERALRLVCERSVESPS